MHPKSLTKEQFSLLMANVLIHFDNALYGYLVPLIAPLFFPKKEAIVQLMWGYTPFIISFLAKPLGLLLLSKMAENGRETAVLRYTLWGIGISLIVTGALPIYQQGATWNVMLLLLARTFSEACASGQHNIAKIYILEGIALQPAKKLAGFYEVSTMVGIISAGATATCLGSVDNPQLYWRLPFLIAGVATLLNLLFSRLKPIDGKLVYPSVDKRKSLYLQLWQARKPIIRIAVVTGFSYAIYAISFLFIGSFVPMVTTITYSAMMQYLPIFMLFDIVLIVWISQIGQKADHNNLMAVASGLVALSIMPIFAWLPGSSMAYVILIRCWLIFLGVAFSSFVTIWSKEQIDKEAPYVTIGLATALGTGLFGKSATALAFYLFHRYDNVIAPSCYIALLAFAATLIMADSASD